MARSRKSQRKLDRKEAFFDPNFRDKDSSIYNSYLGGILWSLDDNFQDNQMSRKWQLGYGLANAIGDFFLTPERVVSPHDLFVLIQRYENESWARFSRDTQRIKDSDYAIFREISSRLSYGYIGIAQYYLRKEQREFLRQSPRAHSSYRTEVYINFIDDHLDYCF